MKNTLLSNQDAFDLPAFLLGEIYGPQYEEGKRLNWTLQDAVALAQDMKRYDGIDADPEEIYEIMMAFDAQDAEAERLSNQEGESL